MFCQQAKNSSISFKTEKNPNAEVNSDKIKANYKDGVLKKECCINTG